MVSGDDSWFGRYKKQAKDLSLTLAVALKPFDNTGTSRRILDTDEVEEHRLILTGYMVDRGLYFFLTEWHVWLYSNSGMFVDDRSIELHELGEWLADRRDW